MENLNYPQKKKKKHEKKILTDFVQNLKISEIKTEKDILISLFIFIIRRKLLNCFVSKTTNF